jgi:hypothetical protein
MQRDVWCVGLISFAHQGWNTHSVWPETGALASGQRFSRCESVQFCAHVGHATRNKQLVETVVAGRVHDPQNLPRRGAAHCMGTVVQ